MYRTQLCTALHPVSASVNNHADALFFRMTAMHHDLSCSHAGLAVLAALGLTQMEWQRLPCRACCRLSILHARGDRAPTIMLSGVRAHTHVWAV